MAKATMRHVSARTGTSDEQLSYIDPPTFNGFTHELNDPDSLLDITLATQASGPRDFTELIVPYMQGSKPSPEDSPKSPPSASPVLAPGDEPVEIGDDLEDFTANLGVLMAGGDESLSDVVAAETSMPDSQAKEKSPTVPEPVKYLSRATQISIPDSDTDARFEKLRKDLEDAHAELRRVRSELHETRTEVEEAHRESKMNRSELFEARAELDQSRTETQTVQSELRATQSQLVKTEQDLEECKDGYEAAMQGLNEKYDEDLSQVNAEHKDLLTSAYARFEKRLEQQAADHATQLEALRVKCREDLSEKERHEKEALAEAGSKFERYLKRKVAKHDSSVRELKEVIAYLAERQEIQGQSSRPADEPTILIDYGEIQIR